MAYNTIKKLKERESDPPFEVLSPSDQTSVKIGVSNHVTY